MIELAFLIIIGILPTEYTEDDLFPRQRVPIVVTQIRFCVWHVLANIICFKFLVAIWQLWVFRVTLRKINRNFELENG